MSGVLTFLTAVLGGGLVRTGWRTWMRARFRVTDPGRTRRGRRRGWVLIGIGGVLALLPELPAALLGILPDRSALVVLGLVLYRLIVAMALLAVVGTITLAHERVTTPVGRVVGDARDHLRSLPIGPGRRARSLRRELGVPDFPADWDAVAARDRDLSARLMAYETDEHARANRPAMRDFADPVVARAYESMLAADALRTSRPTRRGTDALESDYGRAVARFQVAFEAAEAHAATALAGPELDAISRAERSLAFLRENHASPAEREQAYADLRAALDRAREESAGSPAAHRAHPWLDVAERARS